MSKQHHIVDIVPPEYGDAIETMVFSNFTCPVCHGTKQFLDQTGRNEYQRRTCIFCDGTGKVKAKISVAWSPDYNS